MEVKKPSKAMIHKFKGYLIKPTEAMCEFFKGPLTDVEPGAYIIIYFLFFTLNYLFIYFLFIYLFIPRKFCMKIFISKILFPPPSGNWMVAFYAREHTNYISLIKYIYLLAVWLFQLLLYLPCVRGWDVDQ